MIVICHVCHDEVTDKEHRHTPAEVSEAFRGTIIDHPSNTKAGDILCADPACGPTSNYHWHRREAP